MVLSGNSSSRKLNPIKILFCGKHCGLSPWPVTSPILVSCRCTDMTCTVQEHALLYTDAHVIRTIGAVAFLMANVFLDMILKFFNDASPIWIIYTYIYISLYVYITYIARWRYDSSDAFCHLRHVVPTNQRHRIVQWVCCNATDRR